MLRQCQSQQHPESTQQSSDLANDETNSFCTSRACTFQLHTKLLLPGLAEPTSNYFCEIRYLDLTCDPLRGMKVCATANQAYHFQKTDTSRKSHYLLVRHYYLEPLFADTVCTGCFSLKGW